MDIYSSQGQKGQFTPYQLSQQFNFLKKNHKSNMKTIVKNYKRSFLGGTPSSLYFCSAGKKTC